jgi:hypothetical protein
MHRTFWPLELLSTDDSKREVKYNAKLLPCGRCRRFNFDWFDDNELSCSGGDRHIDNCGDGHGPRVLHGHCGAARLRQLQFDQVDATTLLTVLCTPGTTYTLGLDQGVGTGATVAVRLMAGALTGSTLAYTIYSDTARTTVWGNTVGSNTVAGTGSGMPQILTGFGRVPSAQLSAPGAYTDTVTATVTY